MESETGDSGRSKRRKIDKYGRGAALEKLKGLKEKGVKNKYEVEYIDNVYEEVDEKEYTKKVLQRQDDDWIVDDDGSGYVEDGREIFDDDLDEASVASAKKKSKRNLSKNIEKSTGQKNNILNMFANMPTKRKAEEIKTEEDDLLSELMSEIGSENVSNGNNRKTPHIKSETSKNSSLLNEKEAEKEYLTNFSKPQIVKKAKIIPKTAPQPYPTFNPVKPEKVAPAKPTSIDPFDDCDDNIKIEEISSESHSESSKSEVSKFEIETNSNSIPDEFFDDDPFGKDEEDDDVAGKLLDQISNEATSTNSPASLPKVIKFDWNDDFEKNSNSNNKIKNDPKNVQLKDFTVETEDGRKPFRFFWWDAYEDPFKSGTIFLFGKVFNRQSNKYFSCCVTVKNIERKIYILPRRNRLNLETNTETEEKVSMLDVYNEFNTKFANNVMFRSREVKKSYCFDIEGIPVEADYLEIRYPAEKGRLLKSDTPSETFQHVFGTDSNILEIFLLDRKLKGPKWLDINDCTMEANPVSWCQINVVCNKISDITIANSKEELAIPPISLVAINVKTVENPKTKKDEIVMIAWMSHSNYNLTSPTTNPPYEQYYCAITHPSDQMWTFEHNELFKSYQNKKVERCSNERSLLNYFLAIFLNQDPDLIVGHDLIGYQLDILFNQICQQKIQNWSRLGKLRRKVFPHRIRNIQTDAVPGRLVCDLKISAQELVKCRSYDLNTLCEEILQLHDDQRLEIRSEQVRGFYEMPQGLEKLINATMQDTTFILKMMYELNAIPLAVQITNISGFILSRTLLGGRSERNEYLLLHAFDNRGFIVPDKFGSVKYEGEETKVETRKKAAYVGGLVLEPEIGWYDEFILLMDFNSLYPSIIQEYNICFTSNVIQNEDGSWSIEEMIPNPVLPTEIRKLVESRRQVKTLMKVPNLTPELYQQYNIRQMALKLTANSMYGCLGYNKSRFYSQNLAAMITQFGREILSETKHLVERQCYNVVYGDTDSLMINTKLQDYDEVFKIGYKIKKEVNKKYKNVELDIDGVFKYLLLVRKKKYAALTVSKNEKGKLVYKQEIKGLDIVRRDWSKIASEAGKFIIDTLFDDSDKDAKFITILDHLKKLKDDIEKKKVPPTLFAITKQLTKDPKLYADKKSNPHVLVAMRHNSKSGSKKFRQGDSIYYVICEDGTDLPPMQRAYHIEEFKASSELKIDSKYYLSQQIYPIVSRICQPIEGFDLVEVANSLGLDGMAMKKSQKNVPGNSGVWQANENQKYSNADPFKFTCPTCLHVTEINESKSKMINLDKCGNGECEATPISYLYSIKNQFNLQIRGYIRRYYDYTWTCDVPGCEVVIKGIPNTSFTKQKLPECECGEGVLYNSYSDINLYKQILFFSEIFETSEEDKRSVDTKTIFNELFTIAEQYLEENAWGIIDIGALFQPKSKKLIFE